MENRKEIIKGYFVGDIVMLERETKLTKKENIQILGEEEDELLMQMPVNIHDYSNS